MSGCSWIVGILVWFSRIVWDSESTHSFEASLTITHGLAAVIHHPGPSSHNWGGADWCCCCTEILPPPQLITGCGDPRKQTNATASDLRIPLILESSQRRLTLQDVLNRLVKPRLFITVCLCRLTVFIEIEICVHLLPVSSSRP